MTLQAPHATLYGTQHSEVVLSTLGKAFRSSQRKRCLPAKIVTHDILDLPATPQVWVACIRQATTLQLLSRTKDLASWGNLCP